MRTAIRHHRNVGPQPGPARSASSFAKLITALLLGDYIRAREIPYADHHRDPGTGFGRIVRIDHLTDPAALTELLADPDSAPCCVTRLLVRGFGDRLCRQPRPHVRTASRGGTGRCRRCPTGGSTDYGLSSAAVAGAGGRSSGRGSGLDRPEGPQPLTYHAVTNPLWVRSRDHVVTPSEPRALMVKLRSSSFLLNVTLPVK